MDTTIEPRLDVMKRLLLELLPEDMSQETDIPGVHLVRRDHAFAPRPQLYRPEIIILAQGKKNVYVGEHQYTYDANNYFVLAVPLPVICEGLIKPGEPLLGIGIQLEPRMISELLSEMPGLADTGTSSSLCLYQAALNSDIVDASIRLLKASKSPASAKVLGPLIVKEILFRVLNGENGDLLKEIGFGNRALSQISRVIGLLHENYAQPVDIPSLAKEAGMSLSSFHANFRQATNSSPLQYLKNIRLHRAKDLIQQDGEKAYQAASLVGYESVSQFSREYKRCFGVSPGKKQQPVWTS